jgi:hypothetical protein
MFGFHGLAPFPFADILFYCTEKCILKFIFSVLVTAVAFGSRICMLTTWNHTGLISTIGTNKKNGNKEYVILTVLM